MTKIAVLAGGASDERAVSLRSGAAIISALKESNYEVAQFDVPENLADLTAPLRGFDVIFPVLHGKGGEDGILQHWLETNNYKYIGPDAASSKICFDKMQYTYLLISKNIVAPVSQLVTADSWDSSLLTKGPYVLKPNDGGSSIDTFIIHDPAHANNELIQAALRRYKEMLLQSLIDGIEITVGVLLDEALPVIEIIPPKGLTFDYENKYNGATQELCPPTHVNIDLQDRARKLALTIHNLTGCRDFSRTDLIIRDEELYVLETNTIPGMTSESLLPKAAAVAGYSMATLTDLLVKTALSR